MAEPPRALSFPTTPAPAPAPPETFRSLCETMEIEFDDGDLERLGRFLGAMLEANAIVNLTAIRSPDEAWVRHVFDALTLIPVLSELDEGSRIIDVGAGGGVPGVPLGIAMSDQRFTLLDATGKKVAFLRWVVDLLGLGNVEVIQGRAEHLGQDRGSRTAQGREGGHREAYDGAIARAVGPLRVVAELTVPLVRPGGVIVLVKGDRADEELEEASNALRVLNAMHVGTV
ncbi:MAG: 16S rRNA (guanine(527)-N(7))-methyltransferase RsmG, partial [Phycisphaerales bacterium]|nr:16S rRNA (guanine(527)-N(7))-methyltransferase RsmG [Phycisphaerales bacterium]